MKYYILAIFATIVVFAGFYTTLYMFSSRGIESTNIRRSTGIETSTPGGYLLSGTLIVKLKDVPKEWGESSNVFIHYSSIEIHRTGAGNQSGWSQVVEKDNWIDLRKVLTYSEVIGECSLPPGEYNLIRFEILEGIVTVGGVNYTSPVESGKFTIVITKGGIRIMTWQTSILVIDISPKVVGSGASGFKIIPSAKAYAET